MRVRVVVACVLTLACILTAEGKDLPGPFAKSTTQIEFAKGLLARNLFPEAADEFTKFIKEFPADPRMAQAIYWRGEALFGADRYGEAAIDFNTYLTKYKNSEKQNVARLRYGCCLFETGRHARAAAVLKPLAAAGIGNSTGQIANYYLGLCYRALGKYPPALAAFGKLDKGPFAGDALYERAEVKSTQGRHDEAAELFRLFIKKHPEHRRANAATLRRGEELRIAGKLDTAAAIFLTALKSPSLDSRSSVRARYGLGWVRYAQKNYSAARDLASKIAADRKAVLAEDANYLIGLCSLQLKDYGGAEAAFAKVKGGEYLQDAAVKRTWAFLAAGKNDTAVAAVDECLRLFPNVPRAELDYVAGKALAGKKAWKDAAERFSKARGAKAAYHAEAAYELGRTLAVLGDNARAGAAYRYFLSNFPQHGLVVEVMAQLGQTLVRQKKYAESALLYGKILIRKDVPNHAREHALSQQAVCYYWTKEYSKMKKTYEQLLKTFPKGKAAAEALYWLAWHQYENGKFAEAAGLCEKLLKRFSDHPLAGKARYRRAMSFYQSGREGEAAQALYEIVAKHPDTPLEQKEILWLGQYLMKTKKLAEADSVFGTLLKPPQTAGRETRALALYFQAESRRRRGDWSSALKKYEQSLAEKDADLEPAARFGRAICLRRLGRLKETREALAGVKLSPDDPLVAHYYAESGFLDYAEKKYASAAANLMRVGMLYDDEELCGEALLTAGQACLKAGDNRKARICFEELAGVPKDSFGRRYPNSPNTKRGKEELKKLMVKPVPVLQGGKK